MNRNGGKIILWGLILAMLVFTAIRTLHFLMQTFPADQQYVAYLGLAAFDIGVLGWFYYATHSAEGAQQRTIAYGMIFVCMAGVLATTIADMVLVASQNGLTKLPTQWATVGLWGVIIVIVLNVAAGIIVHLVDPKHQKHMAVEHARDAIHATTMEHIKRQADSIAPQIAAQVAQHWAQQTIAEMTRGIPGTSPHSPALPAPVVDSTARALPQQQSASPVQQAPKSSSDVLGAIKALFTANPQPGDGQDTGPLAVPSLNSQANQSNGMSQK